MYDRQLAIDTLITDDMDTTWSGAMDYLYSMFLHGFKGYTNYTDDELVQELNERFGDRDE